MPPTKGGGTEASIKKRIFAWIGIILLLFLYLSSLVLALIGSAWARDCLKVTVMLSVIIPVILYAGILAARVRHDNLQDEDENETQQTNHS